MIAYISLAVLVATALGMLMRLLRSLKQYQLPQRPGVSSSVPSVSVCIPARNEMHALADCLEKVLASTYPKLEVIVYDDESQDETPTIIKSFAHEGVRFVGGEGLPDGWVGRNFALETLAREASGAYIVFMDVDTSIRPETIGELIGAISSQEADMMSVLPRRQDTGRASVWFGTLRYFWQLAGLFSSRAAVSSSLWLVRRDVLLAHGAFVDQKASVEPEAEIAALLGRRYQYVTGAARAGVSFEKKWRSQIDTGRRLLYSQYGVLGLLLLVLLNMPTLIIVYSIVAGWAVLVAIAIVVWALFILVYAVYLRRAWARNWLLGAFLWPYVVLQELIVMIMSMWEYIRGTTRWKRRTVRLR